jgi:hypothetical protein
LIARVVRMPFAKCETFAVDAHTLVPVSLWVASCSMVDCRAVSCS